MTDLVGTCPRRDWAGWLAEGDTAGEPETGTEYGWYTGHRLAHEITPGDRFYVVAHDRLRGWAPVTRLLRGLRGDSEKHTYVICREGQAQACSIAETVPGFRGLRVRWWDRSREFPFDDWREPDAGSQAADVRAAAPDPLHYCHWPGCAVPVPPAMWGCAKHWRRLPHSLRKRIWASYRAGQETDKRPSAAYLDAARDVQEWIARDAPRDLFGPTR